MAIPSGLRRFLFVNFILICAFGCAEDSADPDFGNQGLPAVVRFTAPSAGVGGDSGIVALERMEYDLFDFDRGIVLDEKFSDLSAWETVDRGGVGEQQKDDVSFALVREPECAGQSALRVSAGMQDMAMIETAPSKRSYTACMRIKIPEGASFEAIMDCVCLIEVTLPPHLGIRAMGPANFVGIHYAWNKTTQRGPWIDLYQVFIPKEKTRTLMLGFNGRCEGLRNIGDILVDRIMVREATVAEFASAMKNDLAGDADMKTPLLDRFMWKSEIRDALVTGTPGRLVLPVAPGDERVFSFGLALPAAGARGHCRDVQIVVSHESGQAAPRILLEETLEEREALEASAGWLERSVSIPACAEPSRIVLHSRTSQEGAGIVAWGAPLLVRPNKAEPPFNVILISIDTLRADRLGAYGGRHKEGVSPFIDSVARQGLLFEQTVAQAPYTLPSHVSMLSGQYPTVHGVQRQNHRINNLRTPMLAPILREAGYVTGAFTAGVLVDHIFGFDAGFDTYGESEPLTKDKLSHTLNWLDANRELPFFLFFHTFAVHAFAYKDPAYIDRFDPNCKSVIHDINTAPEWLAWLEDSDTHTDADRNCLDNKYAAGIRMSDDGVKRIFEHLQRLGILDRTLIVITSDHGQEILDRGFIDHGHSLYEEMIHVPLIIRTPVPTPSRRIPDLVELIDIAPTILEYLGITLPPGIQGRSLIPYFDPTGKPHPKRTTFSEVNERVNIYSLRSKEWKILHNPDPQKMVGEPYREFEFYRLNEDPAEIEDLTTSEEEFERFRDQLKAFRKNLEKASDSLKDLSVEGGEIDLELLEELRAQGYIR